MKRPKEVYKPELPIMTDEVGKAFPTYIKEASRLQITFKDRALTSCLHLNNLELTQEC